MTPPATAVAEALPRPVTRRAPVRHSRRTSGPARPAPRAAPRTADRGLALRAIGAYERVSDSALLDRLVRGRLWIGLLGFALIGIVAMQLMVLKLNTGIGATLAREAALQRANAQLGIEAATGTGEGRIEPLAAATGMTFAPSGSVHFLDSSAAADISRAVAALAAPIQPHETSAAGPEAQAASGEAPAAEPSAGSAEVGAGRSSSGSSETAPSQSGAGESGSTGSSEAAPREARSSEASAAATSESETTASAAGGVAPGH